MAKLKETIIYKDDTAAITKIATPVSATAEDAATKVNELIQKLKDNGIIN